jgi:hypothetical protein
MLVTLLKNFDHGFVGMIVRFHAIDGHVQIGIERFSSGVDALKAVPRERVPELLVDQLEAFAIFLVGWIVVRA